MADIRPFQGLRYNTSLAGPLADLLCPPYDVISPQERQALSQRSPYNMVRLELPVAEPEQDRYTEAARQFRQWQERMVLVRDRQPSLYLVRHRFTHAGATRELTGLMACVRLEEWGKGSVYPHEQTSAAPKQDRLALMELCHANFSPVLCLYRDAEGRMADLLGKVRQSPPDQEFQVDGTRSYALWLIQDRETLESVQQALSQKPLYLADGHHRYETALTYRDRRRQEQGNGLSNAAYNFVFMTLVSLDDPGMLVLPYHRLAGHMDAPTFTRLRDRLGEVFAIQPVPAEARTPSALVELVERRSREAMTIGVLGPDGEGPYLLTLHRPLEVERHLPWGAQLLRKVESWVVHEAVLRPVLGDPLERYVAFSHDASDAWEKTCQGHYQMAFFLRPFPLDLFEEVVGAGIRLPPKSTYFYPKLPTGLVINPLEGEL